jgi:hypothetical protein
VSIAPLCWLPVLVLFLVVIVIGWALTANHNGISGGVETVWFFQRSGLFFGSFPG